MDTRRRADSREREPRSADIRAAAATVDVEVVELHHLAPPRRGPGPQLLVGAIVVVLGTLVLLTRFPSGGSSDAVPTFSAGPIASTDPGVAWVEPAHPTSTLPATPQPEPLEGAWAVSELRGFEPDASVAGIWALRGRLIAEVESGGPRLDRTSHLLVSTDGTRWTDLALPFPGFRVEARTVAGGRLHLLGRGEAVRERRPQRWSTDGSTWAREADPEGLAAELGTWVVELAHADACRPAGPCAPSWAAIVRHVVSGYRSFDELRISADGVRWQPVDIAGGPTLGGLTNGHGTWFVLAAHGLPMTTEPHTDVLSSADGVEWTRTVLATGSARGLDLVDGVAGLVVVGAVGSGAETEPYVWLSGTGAGWIGLSQGMRADRPGAGMDLVVATDHGYAAMSATTGDAWISTDGEHWLNRPAFAAASGDRVRALACGADTLVAAGRSAAGRPVFWSTSLQVVLGRA